MRNLTASDHAHCKSHSEPGDLSPVMYDGALHLPASAASVIGMGPTDEECTGGLLLMRAGMMGLQVTMTPEAMRNMAAALIDIASLAEANAARIAGEAIARATGKSRT